MKILCFFFRIIFFVFTFSGLLAFEKDLLPGTIIDGDIRINENEDLWDRGQGPLVDMRKKRWAGGIVPYDFNETIYNEWDIHIIREAMMEIERDTCINFVRRKNEKDYIYITSFGGCWSYIGRQGLQQILSLTAPLCINKGTVIHEFMHSLGFWHEHSRSDRDEYIDILWENVMDEEKKANFEKHLPEAANFVDFPYDYWSVMHYDAYAFSKSPKLPTMKPKKPNVRLRDLGRAKAVGVLTITDREKLKALYECENVK